MKNFRQILSLIALAIIALMYLATLVIALFGQGNFLPWLVAAMVCTLVFPVLIHLLMIMSNMKKGGDMFGEVYDYKKKPSDNKSESSK